MKKRMNLIVAIVLLFGTAAHAQNAVSLDSISGFMAPNKLAVGQPITFAFRYQATMPPNDGWGGFSTGFDLYSPDGATWTPTTQGWATNMPAMALRSNWQPASFFIHTFSLDGNFSDTVAATAFEGNFPFGDIASFDARLFSIATAGFPFADSGKTFCIDSCTNYPPSNDWSFLAPVSFTFHFPTFGSGPYAVNYTPGQGYCFTLAVPPYMCGDINNDGTITVADLVYFVQSLFNGGPAIPHPLLRANVNCSANVGPTVADVLYLAMYLFNNGQAPCANCPQ